VKVERRAGGNAVVGLNPHDEYFVWGTRVTLWRDRGGRRLRARLTEPWDPVLGSRGVRLFESRQMCAPPLVRPGGPYGASGGYGGDGLLDGVCGIF